MAVPLMTCSGWLAQLIIDKFTGGFGLRDLLYLAPTFPFEPVAGARSAVIVDIVDAAQDVKLAVEDSGRLEVIAHHPLAAHFEDIAGHIGEAALL